MQFTVGGSLIQISAPLQDSVHRTGVERIELLRARIAFYRRYLREEAEGDMARAYLWLIRRDEIEVTTITASGKTRSQAEPNADPQNSPPARSKRPKIILMSARHTRQVPDWERASS